MDGALLGAGQVIIHISTENQLHFFEGRFERRNFGCTVLYIIVPVYSVLLNDCEKDSNFISYPPKSLTDPCFSVFYVRIVHIMEGRHSRHSCVSDASTLCSAQVFCIQICSIYFQAVCALIRFFMSGFAAQVSSHSHHHLSSVLLNYVKVDCIYNQI